MDIYKEFLSGKTGWEELFFLHHEEFTQSGVTFSRNPTDGDPEPPGLIPLQQQDGRRFTVLISCLKFERVTPDRPTDRNVSGFKELIENDTPIAPPILFLHWREDGEFWEVGDHEGRGRCKAIKDLFGGFTIIPVDIIARIRENPDETSRKLRKGLITPKMLDALSNGVVSQNTSPLSEDLVDDLDLFLTSLGITDVRNI